MKSLKKNKGNSIKTKFYHSIKNLRKIRDNLTSKFMMASDIYFSNIRFLIFSYICNLVYLIFIFKIVLSKIILIYLVKRSVNKGHRGPRTGTWDPVLSFISAVGRRIIEVCHKDIFYLLKKYYKRNIL